MFPDLPIWLDVPLSCVCIVALAFAACLLLAVVVALIACVPYTVWSICFGEGREIRRLRRNVREQAASRNADGDRS